MIEQMGIDLGLGIIRTMAIRQMKRNATPRITRVGAFVYGSSDYRAGLAACRAVYDDRVPVVVSFPFAQVWMTPLPDPTPPVSWALEQQYLAELAQHTWGVESHEVRLDRVQVNPDTAFCIAARTEAVVALERTVSDFFPHLRAIAVDAFALLSALSHAPPEWCYIHDATGMRHFQIEAGIPVQAAVTTEARAHAQCLNEWTICRGLATWGFTTAT
ncbi:MAG: hypothetical protein A3J38_10460 [Gammaproteobacteria bacterium RIFCSPHIGHO2_12_FULL_45_9]|nr:MAG: hypothetical protein A3J38_10460 [Gammaproteobacteria bacterium RIFCSPHIGHO2_12_FULL_45_9]